MVAAGARLFRLDTGVYFFTVNSNIFRRVNADSDLSATHAKHGDVDLASNGDGFADATGQYQHAIPLNWFRKYQGTNTPEMWACHTNYNRSHVPSGRFSVWSSRSCNRLAVDRSARRPLRFASCYVAYQPVPPWTVVRADILTFSQDLFIASLTLRRKDIRPHPRAASASQNDSDSPPGFR
jgi:hypothetical protein